MAWRGVVHICVVINLMQVFAGDYDTKLDYDAVCGTPKCEKFGQVFPNCQDCFSFLQCSVAGGPKKRVPCPSGQYFDTESKKCGKSSSSCPLKPTAKFPAIRGWGQKNPPPYSPPSNFPPELDEYPDFLARMSYKGKQSPVVRYAPDVGEVGADGKVLDKFFSETVLKSDDKRFREFQKSYPYSRLF